MVVYVAVHTGKPGGAHTDTGDSHSKVRTGDAARRAEGVPLHGAAVDSGGREVLKEAILEPALLLS
jgi:hypothetical protein